MADLPDWEVNICGKGVVCFTPENHIMVSQQNVVMFLAFSKNDNSPIVIWIDLEEWKTLCQGRKCHWHAFNHQTFFKLMKKGYGSNDFNTIADKMLFLEELSAYISSLFVENDDFEKHYALDKLATFYDEIQEEDNF